jgi:hypothetical protein
VSTEEHAGSYKRYTNVFDVKDSNPSSYSNNESPNVKTEKNVSNYKKNKLVTFIFQNDLEYENYDVIDNMYVMEHVGYIGLIILVALAIVFLLLLYFFYDVVSMYINII